MRGRENRVSIFLYFACCSLTDRQTDKIFIEYMLIFKRNLHRNNIPLSLLDTEKIAFPLNIFNKQTLVVNRVASLQTF